MFYCNIYSHPRIDVTIRVPPFCPAAAHNSKNKIKDKLLQDSLRHTIIHTAFLDATEEQQQKCQSITCQLTAWNWSSTVHVFSAIHAFTTYIKKKKTHLKSRNNNNTVLSGRRKKGIASATWFGHIND